MNLAMGAALGNPALGLLFPDPYPSPTSWGSSQPTWRSPAESVADRHAREAKEAYARAEREWEERAFERWLQRPANQRRYDAAVAEDERIRTVMNDEVTADEVNIQAQLAEAMTVWGKAADKAYVLRRWCVAASVVTAAVVVALGYFRTSLWIGGVMGSVVLVGLIYCAFHLFAPPPAPDKHQFRSTRQRLSRSFYQSLGVSQAFQVRNEAIAAMRRGRR